MSDVSGPVVVLLSNPRPRPTTNPYVVMLAEGLEAEPGVEVRYFSWRDALLARYDVFHAHWPEILSEGRTPLRRTAREALNALFLARLAVRRVGVVRTVHNVEPPQGLGPVQRWLLARFDAMTDVRVRINETTPTSPGQEWVTILHGHYRGWFARFPREPQVPGRVTYFGAVRRYKSVDRLLDAFTGTAEAHPELTLTVSGKPSSDELRAMVERACADDPRISARLEFIDDDELVRQVSASELVVLPYRHMHNSGGVLAALSLDRPVLVPENETNSALAAEVGDAWVQRFGDELDGADILRALTAVRLLREGDRPDLSRREWASAARDHVAAYRRAREIARPVRASTPR